MAEPRKGVENVEGIPPYPSFSPGVIRKWGKIGAALIPRLLRKRWPFSRQEKGRSVSLSLARREREYRVRAQCP